MAKLPASPGRPLPKLGSKDVVDLAPGTVLVRVYTVDPYGVAWNTFRHYGPTRRGRFDHHPLPAAGHAPLSAGDHPGHGILCAAGDAVTALVEFFQSTTTIHRARNRPWIATFALARPVRVLDLGGSWPTQAGASQALTGGDRPAATQAWARAIYEDYPDLAGILYPSAMRGRPREPLPALVDLRLFAMNVALFERAAAALPAHPRVHQRLDHPGLADLLASVAEVYHYDVI